MSIPIKHHYVPQVHIKKFKSKDGYFIYNKKTNKVRNQKTSIDIFSVKNLNTTIDEHTKVKDVVSLENELTEIWDSNFNSHYDIIVDWINKQTENISLDISEINESLYFFFEYTIVSIYRSLKKTKEFQEKGFQWVDELDETKNVITEIITGFEHEDKDLFINDFFQFLDKIIELKELFVSEARFPVPISSRVEYMVPKKLICNFYIVHKDSFILPDNTGYITRSSETYKRYSYDVPKVHSVVIPLSPSIVLEIIDEELASSKTSTISIIDYEEAQKLNDLLYKGAFDEVLFLK